MEMVTRAALPSLHPFFWPAAFVQRTANIPWQAGNQGSKGKPSQRTLAIIRAPLSTPDGPTIRQGPPCIMAEMEDAPARFRPVGSALLLLTADWTDLLFAAPTGSWKYCTVLTAAAQVKK